MNRYVLDASAVLALLNHESGQDKVAAIIDDSIISAVNLCEVIGKLIDTGLSPKDAQESLDLLNIETIPFDSEMAWQAATLLPLTKKFGLSLGDRSCLALGLIRSATVVTAERIWAKVSVGATIELIR